ncbi:MAG: transferrin-binding protein-like solute binding protein [Porticoccaceae bacterium]|jgi:hypothetical protein|nr:transferrin-binding protein-like solute binding protein [Porticoccaceae bacterium]
MFRLENIAKKTVLSLAITTSAFVSVGAQAFGIGESSDANYVVVGDIGGDAGIGVAGFLGGTLVAADHFALPATQNPSTGVYNFSGRELVEVYGAPGSGPVSHRELGIWSFKNIDSTAAPDVWFGDWHEENLSTSVPRGEIVAGTHTVFYVGADASASTPTTGSATYTVEGINNYHTTGTLLTGTLTAKFGTGHGSDSNTLKGTLSRAPVSGTTSSLALDAAINTGNGTFSGSATANGTVSGNSSGRFYGANVDALAGIAVFSSNRDLDTAFGGTK